MRKIISFLTLCGFTLLSGIPVLEAADSPKKEKGKTFLKFHDPVEKDIEGWTIKVDPRLLSKEHEALGRDCFRALANHLQRVKYILPKEKVMELENLIP